MSITTIHLGKLDSPRVMTNTEAAYAAGIVDGEGSICITAATMPDQRRPQLRLVVSITNTDFSLLESLALRIGVGTMQQARKVNVKWKDSGQLVFNHEAADYFLRQVRPYLLVKAEQADIAMQFMALKREWAKSKDNYADQLECRQRVMALNGRGKANQKRVSLVLPSVEDRRCEHPGCQDKHYGNGLCRRHYRWKYESKTWQESATRRCQQCDEPLAVNARVDTKFCSVACKMKFHRAQGAYTAEALVDARKCEVDGCERPHHAGGLCRRHYMQNWHAKNPRRA